MNIFVESDYEIAYHTVHFYSTFVQVVFLVPDMTLHYLSYDETQVCNMAHAVQPVSASGADAS